MSGVTGDVGGESVLRAPASAPVLRRRPSALLLLERYALVLLLVALVAAFTVLPATRDTFPTPANLQNVLANSSVVAVAALAAMVPLVCGQFDVSVGAVLGVSQVAAAALMSRHGWPALVAVAAAVALCAAVGAVNGWLVAVVGVNPLIVTLGVSTLAGGLVSLYTGNQAIVTGIPASVSDFGSGTTLGVPRTTLLLALTTAALWWALRQTPAGRQLTAVGSNASAARLVGLPVRRLVLLSFVLAAALAGVAGVLQLARTGTANPVIGPSYTLPALSAVFLGATTITPGRFNVLGTLVGVAFVAVSVDGLTLAGSADWVDPVFNGAALVLAVSLSTVVGRRRAAR